MKLTSRLQWLVLVPWQWQSMEATKHLEYVHAQAHHSIRGVYIDGNRFECAASYKAAPFLPSCSITTVECTISLGAPVTL